MYFHVYTPARNPATLLRDMAAQHVDYGKPIPVTNVRERPSAHHHTTASSVCSAALTRAALSVHLVKVRPVHQVLLLEAPAYQ